MEGLGLTTTPAGVALLAAAATAIAFMLGFVGLGRLIERQQSVRERIDALSSLPTPGSGPSAAGQDGGPLQPVLGALDRLLARRSFSASVATELARANLLLTVPEYTLITIGCGLALLALALILSRQMILALAGGLLGLYLPRLYVRRLQAKRLVAFQDQLPDILALLVGSLRSGYGITMSMDMVAKQMPPPASDEFNRVVREVGLGASASQALANLVRRVRSDDLDLIVTAIGVQYEVGGNLAVILDTITATIRERVRLKGQLRVLTAQTSLQRTILTLLPVILAVIMYVLNPAYVGVLFEPGPWILIPISAAVLVVIGYVVMGKLSKVEF